MKQIKTWATIHSYEGDAHIELTINYQEGTYSLCSGNSDSVGFEGPVDGMKVAYDRIKCVKAALDYAKTELL